MNAHCDRAAWLLGPKHACQGQPAVVQPTRRIVLLGAPGVGKGTQSALIAATYGACPLSTGDIFRAARASEATDLTPPMREAIDHMHRGELVPDNTVLRLVRERMRCLTCSGGFILDGFPRTVPQAAALDVLMAEHQVFIELALSYELPETELIARISGRRICPACTSIYHEQMRPAKRTGICDRCGTGLVQREDDKPAAAQLRQRAYQAATAPLLTYYANRDVLVHIDASGSPEVVFSRTQAAITRKLGLGS